MVWGRQYIHVIIFCLLIAYLDAYLLLVLYFTCADNEHDEDELESEELTGELVDYLLENHVLNKEVDFDKKKFILNEIEVFDDSWDYWVDLWELPDLTEEITHIDFYDPSYNFNGQATSFFIQTMEDQKYSINFGHKKSTAYFALTLDRIKRENENKDYYKKRLAQKKIERDLKKKENEEARILSSKSNPLNGLIGDKKKRLKRFILE